MWSLTWLFFRLVSLSCEPLQIPLYLLHPHFHGITLQYITSWSDGLKTSWFFFFGRILMTKPSNVFQSLSLSILILIRFPMFILSPNVILKLMLYAPLHLPNFCSWSNDTPTQDCLIMVILCAHIKIILNFFMCIRLWGAQDDTTNLYF